MLVAESAAGLPHEGSPAAASGAAAPGVLVGSQDDHARMVSRADRVVALT